MNIEEGEIYIARNGHRYKAYGKNKDNLNIMFCLEPFNVISTRWTYVLDSGRRSTRDDILLVDDMLKKEI